MSLFQILAFALGASALALIAPDVCSSTPYSNFTSLRADAGVLDYCSSVLSTYKPTSTLIIVSTSVVAVARPADSTLTSISVVESTATVSQGAQSTAFTDIWVTKTELMTVTSYISVDTASASASASASACSISSASTLFASLHADQISTACSCLGVLPSSTSLNAMTFVTETKMSTVSRASAAATTFETGFVVLTAEAQTTMAFTFTTTAAETKTVYAAAPSYTQVFGPQTGCADISYLDAQQLNASVTAQNDAVNRCKEYCTNNAKCSSVFVQQMDIDYPPVVPFWKCFINNETFKEGTDTQCGRKAGIWGTAVAFDALNRGQ